MAMLTPRRVLLGIVLFFSIVFFFMILGAGLVAVMREASVRRPPPMVGSLIGAIRHVIAHHILHHK